MKDNIKVTIYFAIFVVFMLLALVGYNKFLESGNISEKTEVVNSKNEYKKKLPVFEVSLENGEKISSEKWVGRPMIINIWTTWCRYCYVEMPYFNELYLKEKDNITFVMINATGDRDSRELAKKYVKEGNYSFQIYYDLKLEAISELGVYSYPTTIFVDKEGYIVSTNVGMITKETLKRKINEIK